MKGKLLLTRAWWYGSSEVTRGIPYAHGQSTGVTFPLCWQRGKKRAAILWPRGNCTIHSRGSRTAPMHAQNVAII